jgi:hypothetical protein
MKHLCAWCQADIRTSLVPSHIDDSTSHGICGGCLGDLERRQGNELLALVEEWPHAAVAVDAELRIRAANQLACDLFQDEWASLLGRRVGELLGCEHEQESTDRGKAFLCPGCELHGILRHTLETGFGGFTTVPAIPLEDPPQPIAVSHQITTLRVGDMVALRFDLLKEVINHHPITPSPSMALRP